MEPSAVLAALEERLSDAAIAWDEAGYEQAAQAIAGHLAAAADTDAAVLEFDSLVETRIDGLADAGDAERADLYGAAVQDFYEACELPVLSAYLGVHRGELMLAAGHGAAAEEVLREAHEVLSEHADPLRAASATLLGTACHDLGRLSDAVRWLRRATELWREVGEEEQAENCLEAVSVAEIGLATEAAGRERYDECEPHAHRALEAADGRNEVLAASASLFIGVSRLRGGAPRDAQELLVPAIEVLRPLRDPGADAAVAVALGFLGEALAWQSDVVGADRCFRECLERARRAGDDEIAEFALLQLLAIAPQRLGPDVPIEPLRRLGGEISDPRIELLAHRNAGMRAMRAGDFAAAHRHLEQASELSRDVPGAVDDGMSLNGMRMVAFLAEGRFGDAELCLRAIDDGLRDAQRRGEAELVAAAPPYLDMWHSLMSITRGDHDEAARGLDRAREQFHAAGATMNAVVTSTLLGVHALHRGGAATSVGHLVPAALAARSELVTLPSSAERAAFRNSYPLIVEVAIRAVATTGDQQLMAELLEELHAQSMPLPPVSGAENRSLSSLMFGLAVGLISPGVAEPGRESRTEAEQDTLLAPSARIRMPWGTIALEQYHDSARRYGTHVVDSTTVTLAVLR